MGAELSKRSTTTDVISNDQAEIFKLKMDNFEQIFDWLSLEDLVMLSQTCKRMQHIVGYCFSMQYAGNEFYHTESGIHRNCYRRDEQIDVFSPYMKKLTLTSSYQKIECHIQPSKPWWKKIINKQTSLKCEYMDICLIPHMKADRYKSLTEIEFQCPIYTDKTMLHIKEILGQLESVKLVYPRLFCENNDFHQSFLQHCINLKKLTIHDLDNIIRIDNSWLLRKYPTLEYFHLSTTKTEPINELQIFFDQNTSIRTFSSDIPTILANSDTFRNTKAKWDVLSVEIFKKDINSCHNLLNELHKRGLFKELHLRHEALHQDSVNQLILFNGLTMLLDKYLNDSIDLYHLINLKYLYIGKMLFNTKIVAQKLVNLEFIRFSYRRIYDIIPFVRYSRNLKKIFVHCGEYGNIFNFISIEELNKERSKLTNARKVTIYVEEKDYLTAKWSKYGTNMNLIEIKRLERCKIDDYFF